MSFELQKKMDSLIHEAQMGIMIDRYNCLHENGVILEGDDLKESTIAKAKRLITGAIHWLQKFVRDIKRKIESAFLSSIKKKQDKKNAKSQMERIQELDKRLDETLYGYVQEYESVYNDISGSLMLNTCKNNDEIMDRFIKLAEKIKKKQKVAMDRIEDIYQASLLDLEMYNKYYKNKGQ